MKILKTLLYEILEIISIIFFIKDSIVLSNNGLVFDIKYKTLHISRKNDVIISTLLNKILCKKDREGERWKNCRHALFFPRNLYACLTITKS